MAYTQDERVRMIRRKLLPTYPALSDSMVLAILKEELEIDLQDLTQSGEVRKTQWGTFKVKLRAQRTTRNPRTGERMTVPEKKVPVFSAAQRLRVAVEPRLAAAAATATPRARGAKAKNGRRRRGA